MGLNALFRYHHDFAVFNFADELCTDDVKRTGFRTENVGAVQFAQNKRANAEGIARANQFLVGEGHQGIGSFETAERINVAVNDTGLFRA
jgi:hypothetical protein